MDRIGTIPMKRLFIDIETCPNIGYFWSAGYKRDISHDSIIEERRIITAAWKWAGEDKVTAVDWGKARDDEKLMGPLLDALNASDEAVAHYGNGFDFPWVRTRAMFHGIVVPVWKTVDTKAWAARYFYLNSNKLDYLAKLLGIGEKLHTEYSLWKDVTLGKGATAKRALDKMVEYNKHDVVILEKIIDKLSLYTPAESHVGVLEGGEKWHCPRCGGQHVKQVKKVVTAMGSLKYEMYCKDCPKYYMIGHPAYKLYVRQKPNSAR